MKMFRFILSLPIRVAGTLVVIGICLCGLVGSIFNWIMDDDQALKDWWEMCGKFWYVVWNRD